MAEKDRRRKIKLNVYLLEEENLILTKKALDYNMSKSEYIRNLIMYGFPKNNDDNIEQIKKYTYELNRIGNNINQIAYRVNSNKKLNYDDIQDIKDKYFELLELFENNI